MGFDPIGEQQGTVRIGEMAVHPRQVWNVTVGEFEVDVDHLARCTGDQGGFSVDNAQGLLASPIQRLESQYAGGRRPTQPLGSGSGPDV